MSSFKISKLLVVLVVVSCGYSSNYNSNNININNFNNIFFDNFSSISDCSSINIDISNHNSNNNNNNHYDNSEQNQIFDRESQLYKKLFSKKYTAISKRRPIRTILNYDKNYEMFINEVFALFRGFKNINIDLENSITSHETLKCISNELKNIFKDKIRIPLNYMEKFAEIFDSFYETENNHINEIREYIELQDGNKLLSMQEVLNYIAQCSNELLFNIITSINELIKNNNFFLQIETLLNSNNFEKNIKNLKKINTILDKIIKYKSTYSSEQLHNIYNKIKLFKINNPCSKSLHGKITKQVMLLQTSTKYNSLYEGKFNIVNKSIEVLHEVCNKLFQLFSEIDNKKNEILHNDIQQQRWNKYIFPNVKILIKYKHKHLNEKFYNTFQYSSKQIFENDFNEFSKLHEKITEIFNNISNTDKANFVNNGNNFTYYSKCNTSSICNLIELGTKNQTGNIYGIDKYGNDYLSVFRIFIELIKNNSDLDNWKVKDFIKEKVVPLLHTFKNLISNNIDYIIAKYHMIRFNETIGLYLDFAKDLTIIIDKLVKCNICEEIRKIIDEYIVSRHK